MAGLNAAVETIKLLLFLIWSIREDNSASPW